MLAAADLDTHHESCKNEYGSVYVLQNGTGSSRLCHQDGASTSTAGLFVPNRLPAAQANSTRSTDEASERINDAYFDSYGFFGIHREMLSDKVLPQSACMFLIPPAHCLQHLACASDVTPIWHHKQPSFRLRCFNEHAGQQAISSCDCMWQSEVAQAQSAGRAHTCSTRT